MSDDYYKILGVSRTATPEQIQKAYRSLAHKHHPDLNPDDSKAKNRFKKIQRAFDVLDDPEKREMYDRYGPEFESIQTGPRPGGGGQPYGEFDFPLDFGQAGGSSGFEEILRQLRGGAAGGSNGGRRRSAPRRGEDVEHEVTVPFSTTVLGGEVQAQVVGPTGAAQTMTVKIPAGIVDGKRLRLRGKGGAPERGGEAGDLYIRVRAAKHPHFVREGYNLTLQLPVTVAEALLGAKVDVPTPYGEITVTIAEGSSSGRRLRIKNFGVARPDGQRGDLMIELQIMAPRSLDDEAKQLVRDLDRRCPLAPRQGVSW